MPKKIVSAHDDISISIRGFHVPIQAGKQPPIASHPFSFWSVVFFSQDNDHRKQIIIEALGSFYTGFSIDKPVLSQLHDVVRPRRNI